MIDRVETLLIKIRYPAWEWTLVRASALSKGQVWKGYFQRLAIGMHLASRKMTPAIYQSCQDTSPTRIVYQYSQWALRAANRSPAGQNSRFWERLGIFSAPIWLSVGSPVVAVGPNYEKTLWDFWKSKQHGSEKRLPRQLRISPGRPCSGELMQRGEWSEKWAAHSTHDNINLIPGNERVAE